MNAVAVINPAPALSMGDIERVALAIAKGGLFGSKDPNAVLTLCFLAHAEGQHPAVVFRDYHIIQGKPAKKADAMLRDFINAGGKVEWHELTDEKADATFTHPSGSARIDWTMARAKTAGLSTAMWQKYPRQMLRSRVISEGIRTVYPGATSGLYEEGEVLDIVAESAPQDTRGKVIEHEPSPPADAMPEDEYNRLTGKMKAAGVSAAKLHKEYGVTDLRELNLNQFNDAIARLDTAIAAKSKTAPPTNDEFGDVTESDLTH